MAEATQAYAPAKQAVQTQLGGLQGQLDTANEQINKNYIQQQSELNRQRNAAASSASMQAAGSGGSFGGMANIANRKYYAQAFRPAQTQLQTNQANDLAQARQNYENQRNNLNAQLANLDATANQAALQQYWAAVEAEKQRQAQLQANAAQNAYYKAVADKMAAGGGNANGNMSFLNYLNSDAYNQLRPSDMSVGDWNIAKQNMANDFNRYMSAAENGNDLDVLYEAMPGNQGLVANQWINQIRSQVGDEQLAQMIRQEANKKLKNIYNGSVYQNYLNYIGGNR